MIATIAMAVVSAAGFLAFLLIGWQLGRMSGYDAGWDAAKKVFFKWDE